MSWTESLSELNGRYADLPAVGNRIEASSEMQQQPKREQAAVSTSWAAQGRPQITTAPGPTMVAPSVEHRLEQLAADGGAYTALTNPEGRGPEGRGPEGSGPSGPRPAPQAAAPRTVPNTPPAAAEAADLFDNDPSGARIINDYMQAMRPNLIRQPIGEPVNLHPQPLPGLSTDPTRENALAAAAAAGYQLKPTPGERLFAANAGSFYGGRQGVPGATEDLGFIPEGKLPPLNSRVRVHGPATRR